MQLCISQPQLYGGTVCYECIPGDALQSHSWLRVSADRVSDSQGSTMLSIIRTGVMFTEPQSCSASAWQWLIWEYPRKIKAGA